MTTQFIAESVLHCQATLGEGPLWDQQREVLWWLDIEEGRVHRYNPQAAENQTFDIGQRIGTVVCCDGAGLMLAVENGLAAFDPHSGSLDFVCDPEADLPNNRFNDGKCDPEGRFWAGTMNLDPDHHRTGSLYSLERGGQVRRHLSGVGVSNGIVWSSDGRTMYYIDSLTGTVDAFNYERASGDISNRRSVFQVPAELVCADGMAIDAEDKLWVAFWGGWCVARIDPHHGTVLAKVVLPVAHVTACAGGRNLDELYITTARHGLNSVALAEQPLAGDLFRARPGVQGTVSSAYRG